MLRIFLPGKLLYDVFGDQARIQSFLGHVERGSLVESQLDLEENRLVFVERLPIPPALVGGVQVEEPLLPVSIGGANGLLGPGRRVVVEGRYVGRDLRVEVVFLLPLKRLIFLTVFTHPKVQLASVDELATSLGLDLVVLHLAVGEFLHNHLDVLFELTNVVFDDHVVFVVDDDSIEEVAEPLEIEIRVGHHRVVGRDLLLLQEGVLELSLHLLDSSLNRDIQNDFHVFPRNSLILLRNHVIPDLSLNLY